MGSKVGHSLASRAGSLLRGTGLNDLSLSFPPRISFSMQGSLPLLQKCRKILRCPVVDNDLTTVHTCMRTHVCTLFLLVPFLSIDACSMRIMKIVQGRRNLQWIRGPGCFIFILAKREPTSRVQRVLKSL